ncbi:Vacuolar-sorting protein SNF7 [Gnomoniopsis sp. IMI 355080]|uniref:Vacuolar-sorting protein SNF7 n=1 Tax=Gnomoniopsis smithogilvyi TaxID=1191159 RepID=A0A9W9CT74_9PEZI|nr:Vacuolar-sorting protein SNF7 [Gnomoniopsis smithogilvyi]KAJ4409704.1 Vacuolar-sorting protein SNF7 [Gnomoniopsis sp. IMI 355080]
MSQRQLARDMQTEFQARFSAKQARREAAKAQKADGEMRKQITNLIKKGDKASMAQAEQKAKVLLAKEAVAKQMDQAADMAELSVAQIQANNAMNRMTAMMMQSSKTMSKAQRQMNPERTLTTLEQFRNQNEEYAMNNSIYQDAMTQSTSAQVSDDAVHELLGKLADDAGVELSQELATASTSKEEPVKETATSEPTPEQEDALQQRLRALRA